MSELPTVEIVNDAAPSGFTRINECDFDPTVHKLFGESRVEVLPVAGETSDNAAPKKRGRPFKVS